MRHLALTLVLLAGCAAPSFQDDPDEDGRELFRDFVQDGKYDEAGHPVSARVTEAEALCSGPGRVDEDRFIVDGDSDGSGVSCEGELAAAGLGGSLILNMRVKADRFDRHLPLGVLQVMSNGEQVAARALVAKDVRKKGRWFNFSIRFARNRSAPLSVVLTGNGNGRLFIDYFELFPDRFDLVLGPGSGVIDEDEELEIETATDRKLDQLSANGQDLLPTLNTLLRQDRASVTTTGFRRVWQVRAGDLLEGIEGTVELAARAGQTAARMQILREDPSCVFEGDPEGRKVLVTGFQPFPADASHENVAEVGVRALRPEVLAGAQVMRLILPVEWDRAGAEVVSAIERCQPEVVISFGQGGYAIELEQTGYNLKDTSEVSGGIPDNRGVVSPGEEISLEGPEERTSTLPLQGIAAALSASGVSSSYSDDPGRYICNNVMYAALGAVEGTTAISGFVHLPYVTSFPDPVRAHWGQVVETIVGAAAGLSPTP